MIDEPRTPTSTFLALNRFKLETFVIKLGGEALADPVAFESLVDDIGLIVRAGVRIVLVHGGGPQATALSRRLGLEPRIVGGRRITDAATLEVMKMTLAGTIPVDMAAMFRRKGIPTVPLSGVAADLIIAKRRPPRVVTGCGDEPVDFGEVGDILSVGTGLLATLLDRRYVPLIGTLGADLDGNVLNINADIAAARIAAAIGASRLLMLTGAKGVLRDPDDPQSCIPRLTVAEAREAIVTGAVRGGMIPKLEESFKALELGVPQVHVISHAEPHAVLTELVTEERSGTLLVP